MENAGLLAPPVLADLVELTRSETAAGRFLQVLLCGTPDLERTLGRAGLTDALRELGVMYRMAAAPAPEAAPRPEAANDRTGNDRGLDTGAMVMPGPADDRPSRRPRRAALYTGTALTVLALIAAAGVALPNGAASLERGWTDGRAFVERSTRDLLGTDRSGEPPAPAAKPAIQTQTQPLPLPLPETLVPPPAPVAQTAPPPTSEATPLPAVLRSLEPPSATTPPLDTDAGSAQRTRALVEQARRQIAGKRLTTPPGDNAFETVQRLRQTAPTAPEAVELTAAMEEIYRRWAVAAERDGDWSEARRFYERAQMMAPGDAELGDRIKAATERRSLGAPAAAPATAAPGPNNRDSALVLLGNPADLSRALQAGLAPDTRIDTGKTLLMIAAEQGLTDAARILLERRARTDLRGPDGTTAVISAAWGGFDSVVAALADAGADLDAASEDGKTALMAAAARGHAGVALLLLQRHVAIDRTTANGWSALMYAANNGHDRVVTLLADRGANPYRMDANGNSALTLGALQGHVQVVEALKPR